MHFSGRNPTQITSAHVGPPTSGSKAGGPKSSGASGAATESGGGGSGGVGGGKSQSKFSHPVQPSKPIVTGWSTDDDRIFAREAAKINLKWARHSIYIRTVMAIRVVEFLSRGYKIRKIIA